MPPSSITVIGIGADGWSGLAEPVRSRISDAAVVIGAERQLGLLPEISGQTRRAWPRPMMWHLEEGELLGEYAGSPVLVLASGDPLVSGIGSSLVRLYGPERVEILPAVSSVSLARARMGWSAEETEVVTVVGRQPETVLRQLSPGRRIVVLSSDAATPATIAGLLVGAGFGASRLTVLAGLGSEHESRTSGTAATWDAPVGALNVIALECVGPATDSWAGSWAPGLPDTAYEHDGQLTKRDVRASALAHLRPLPGQLLWDVGAGAGSVGIEWLRAHPTCRAFAIESDPERATRVRRNAESLGVPSLAVVTGRAPEALHDLPAPDAVFVGGGATAEGLLTLCRERLRPGGRLVAHGVTLETEQVLFAHQSAHGGMLSRISVEHAEPIGSFTGWAPARAVTQWAWEKP